MAGKHFCTIDFIIEGNVFYSRKALVDSFTKPSKSTLVTIQKKRRYPERNSYRSAPQYSESSPDKSEIEEEFELNEEEKSSNDPDYEQIHEDSDLAAATPVNVDDSDTQFKFNGISSHTGSLEVAANNGVRKRRGRKKVQRKLHGEKGSSESGSIYATPDYDGEDEQRKKQEKIEQRRELMRRHMEEVKWQAVHKILNEKGRKEREKEKKAKKEIEDQKAKEAAIEAKKKAALTNIHIKYYKNGSVTLSFPQGFLLPQVLSQDKLNGTAHVKVERKMVTGRQCKNCGNEGKYCNPKSGNVSCSLDCYKAIN